MQLIDVYRQCVNHKKGASDLLRKAPISLECDNWRQVRDYFATKINDINTTFPDLCLLVPFHNAVSLNGHLCDKFANFGLILKIYLGTVI